jgi:cell division septal protein FtsQ
VTSPTTPPAPRTRRKLGDWNLGDGERPAAREPVTRRRRSRSDVAAAGPGRPQPVVDPRMHERRAEVARASGRRRALFVAPVLVVVLVAAGLLAAAHTRLFAVRHVTVAGPRLLGEAGLLSAAGVAVGEPLIDIHPSAAADRLQRLAWVGSATVQPIWPTSLRIVVTQRHPVAQIPTGSSPSGPVAEVDVTGRILARLATARPDLPILLGVGVPGPVGAWVAGSSGAGQPVGSAATRPVALAAALAGATGGVNGALALTAGLESGGAAGSLGSDHARVSRVEVAADGTIGAVVEPGSVTVTFGAPIDLAMKVDALVSMLRSETLQAGSVLDLEVPERPTLSTGPAEILTP